MPKMWPNKIPDAVLKDSKRKAEIKTYEKLRNDLGPDYHVFYSSPWLGTDKLGNEKDGECDFLIAHPDHGMLSVEVKGGKEISFDPTTGQWKSKDHGNFIHKITDPVGQARRAKHALLKKLKEVPRWKTRFIFACHGVIFPDASGPKADLGPDRPAEIFCGATEFHSALGEWVEKRLKAGQRPSNCEPLGRDGIAALEILLAHPFTLSFRIGAALAEAQTEFSTLEPAQYQILDEIVEIPRALIRGGAGTGKTVVAIEEALRAAKSGKRTLLTCHSRPLAEHLKRQLADTDNLTVDGFHAVCGSAARKAGVPLPNKRGKSEFFASTLPNALCDAVDLMPDLKWETIIVDEGQDFRPAWWLSIDYCLTDDGRLRIFLDSNQKVYDGVESNIQDLQVVPIRLTRNLRNTKKIHEASLPHYDGPHIVAGGPEGIDVSWVVAESLDEQIRSAYKEMRRLVFNEEVAPGDIAVLINNPETRERFLACGSGTAIPITDAETMALEDVVVDTVRRFKGLERPAIILIATGEELTQRELAYVAFTRAKAYLCTVATRSDVRWLSGGTAAQPE